MKITWKIVLLLILLFAAVMTPLTLTIDALVVDLYTSHIADELKAEGQKMSSVMDDDQQQHLQHIIRALSEVSLHHYLLVDEKGNPILSTEAAERYVGDLDREPRLREVLQGRPVAFEHRSADEPPHYVVGYPILGTEQQVHGGLFLFASLQPVDEALAHFHRRLLWIGGMALSSALLLIVMFARRLALPLLRMKDVTRELANRRYDARVKVKGADEISQLGESINELGARLQYHEEKRNEFLADVAHELRTPLSYIQGYSQVLEQGWVQDEAEQRRYLQLIVRETQRLQRLVGDLTDLAELQADGVRLEFTAVDLAEVVATTVEKMEPFAQEKGVRLQVLAESSTVRGDRDRLEQVMINLLSNAIRFTEAGGEVKVRLLRRDCECELLVEDTGIGIPPEDLPHLFERFYRVEKSRNREKGGMGLGLAIVKRIVDSHGGRVTVESKLGKGTVVHLTFPIS
jgi:two-component system sensor histidine kinase BaeS